MLGMHLEAITTRAARAGAERDRVHGPLRAVPGAVPGVGAGGAVPGAHGQLDAQVVAPAAVSGGELRWWQDDLGDDEAYLWGGEAP